MEGKLAKVSKLPDDTTLRNKLVIYFTVEGFIEDAIAYPLDVYDECSEGDEVYVYELESILGFSYMYNKVRLEDHTRLKLGDSELDIKDDVINFNGGNNDGLIKINELTDKLNQLVSDFNQFVNTFNSHTHEATSLGSPTTTPIPPSVASQTQQFNKSDYEDTKVNH